MIEGIKCTIVWYMDYNKLLHKNPWVITDIMNEARKCFGDISIVRGNRHNFLGMSIEIKENVIQFDTVEHLEECK